MGKSSSKRAKSKRRSATSSSEAAAAVHAGGATAAGWYQIESIEQQHNTITTVQYLCLSISSVGEPINELL